MKSGYSIDKIGLYAFLAILITIISLGLFIGTSPDNYNRDMDLTRIKDLRDIGALVEEYKTKNGHYPLTSDSDIPNFVTIVTKKQQKYALERPKIKHKLTDVKVFIKTLETGLGRKIILPFDPQLRTTKRPIFYLYVVKGQEYELIAHLYHEYPFTRQIKKHYSKLTISNRSVAPLKIWDYKSLMSDPEFAKTVSTPLKKPGFIKKMRADIRAQGAF